MDKENELRELLNKLPDLYDEFVEWEITSFKRHNAVDDLIAFLKEHPAATTEDVIEFYAVRVKGFKHTDKYSWEE